jgi:hypothetical protein
MESRRGSNNVQFISKHVSKNGFWLHIGSLGFWVRLRFARRYEALPFSEVKLIVFQLKFAQGYKLCNK